MMGFQVGICCLIAHGQIDPALKFGWMGHSYLYSVFLQRNKLEHTYNI